MADRIYWLLIDLARGDLHDVLSAGALRMEGAYGTRGCISAHLEGDGKDVECAAYDPRFVASSMKITAFACFTPFAEGHLNS
jgi:hypothetical protein